MITSKQLTTSMLKIIEGTTTSTVAITTAYLCNNTSDIITINVSVVPAGEYSPAFCKIYNQLVIPGLDTRIIDTEKLILGPGDSIWADASIAGSITMTVSSVGI